MLQNWRDAARFNDMRLSSARYGASRPTRLRCRDGAFVLCSSSPSSTDEIVQPLFGLTSPDADCWYADLYVTVVDLDIDAVNS